MLNNGKLYKLKCLDYCCQEKCTDEICKQLLTEDEFKKYKRFTNAFKIDMDKNLFSCPNEDCGYPINR